MWTQLAETKAVDSCEQGLLEGMELARAIAHALTQDKKVPMISKRHAFDD
jgi:hypothetical protein